MQALIELIDKAKQLDEGLMFKNAISVPDIQDEIARLITLKQLAEGKRADGSTLPNYSEVSVGLYGKPQGPIKLFDTGKFYQSVKLGEITEDYFLTDADPLKVDEVTGAVTNLFEKYGYDTIDLSEENKQNLSQMLIPYLVYEIKSQLQLT